MKLKIIDIIKFRNEYLLLLEYPSAPILHHHTFIVTLEGTEIIRFSGLKFKEDLPASAASGAIYSTSENLQNLMKYNPKKNNIWLEQLLPEKNKRSLKVENKEKKQEAVKRKTGFFIEEIK